MSSCSVARRRVGIIGCGHVGSHVAYSIAIQGIAEEIYLVDTDTAKANSQAIDIQDAVSYLPYRVMTYAGTMQDLVHCNVIVLSAGPLPSPGESRLDTLPRTMAVIKDVIAGMKEHVMDTFKGVIICISNPADIIAAYVQEALKIPAHRVMSTGTCIDSARLQALLARELKGNVHPGSMKSAYMLGEHGDSCIAAWSCVTVGGKSLKQLQKVNPRRYPEFDRAAIQDEVHRRGYHVLSGKGSTEFGIATACAEMIKAIFHNEQKVVPCSVMLHGQYGEENVYASVPVVLGAAGVEDIIELDLNDEEKAGFHHSCDVIRSFMKQAFEQYPIS